jgi:hypothetical protein
MMVEFSGIEPGTSGTTTSAAAGAGAGGALGACRCVTFGAATWMVSALGVTGQQGSWG